MRYTWLVVRRMAEMLARRAWPLAVSTRFPAPVLSAVARSIATVFIDASQSSAKDGESAVAQGLPSHGKIPRTRRPPFKL